MKQEEIWDAVAAEWSEFRARPMKEVVEFLVDKKDKVLDLGCGSGRHSPENLGSELKNLKELEFYGVDFSEKLLELAKEKGYVEVKKSGVDAIHYGDEFFDFGIYIAALHCVESAEAREKSLQELYRVLKDGGLAIISVWSRNQKRVKNKPKEAIVPWTMNGRKYERYYYLYEKDELEGLLKGVGFEVLKSWEDDNIWFEVLKA
jgi:tRNA (uracil-5-)-methyltransferase TRM9